VEAIHFASPPYTSDHALGKVLTLASKMSVYEGHMKVHVINLTANQMSINRNVGDSYSITILRRMMFRLAEQVAQKNGCLALATGESVGQVASQTLESMAVINDVVHMPVLRPLVCMDKVEIIDLARRLGTYETSIEPYEDCCTIFKPQNPVTRPLLRKCEAFETKWDWQSELDQCLASEDTRIVKPAEEEEFL
jgi:thiamine biosynthesis protein ThiI